MEEKQESKIEQTVTNINNNFDKAFNYLKNNTVVRHFIGFTITLMHIFEFVSLTPTFYCLYTGLFFYSCREIVRYHSLMLNSNENNSQLVLNTNYYWISLVCLQVLYYVSQFANYFFDNIFVTLLINYIYFSLFVYSIHDFGKQFTESLPKITCVKRINLFEKSKQNVFLDLVNSGINFYRVNMKVYDHIILTIGSNFFYEFYMIPFDTLSHSNHLADHCITAYSKLKCIFGKLRSKFSKTNTTNELSVPKEQTQEVEMVQKDNSQTEIQNNNELDKQEESKKDD